MEVYYKNELSKLSGACRVQIMDENKWLNIGDQSIAAIVEHFSTPAPLNVRFTRINNDVNGNPRYVMHFLQLLTDDELNGTSLQKYEIALKRARKIGGRKFHNKQYGGGIVFQSYNLKGEVKYINRELGYEKYAGYEID